MFLVIRLIRLLGGLIGLGISVFLTAAWPTTDPDVSAQSLGEQPGADQCNTELIVIVSVGDVRTATASTERVHDRLAGGAAVVAHASKSNRPSLSGLSTIGSQRNLLNFLLDESLIRIYLDESLITK